VSRWRAAIFLIIACVVAFISLANTRSVRAAEKLKLDYVPRDAVFGLVFQPEQTMKLPELEILPWELFTSVAKPVDGH